MHDQGLDAEASYSPELAERFRSHADYSSYLSKYPTAIEASELEISACRMVVASGDDDYGDADNHPNRSPFKAILHQVDRPSTRPPNGSDGHLVLIPRHVASRRLKSLLGMAINVVSGGLGGHNSVAKVGVITAAAIGRDPDGVNPIKLGPISAQDVVVAGHLYEKDHPREVAEIRAAARGGKLGASYEITGVQVENLKASIWRILDFTYIGAAALLRASAAYNETVLAAGAAQTEVDEMTRAELNAAFAEHDRKFQTVLAEHRAGIIEAIEAALSPMAEKFDKAEKSGEDEEKEQCADVAAARQKEIDAAKLDAEVAEIEAAAKLLDDTARGEKIIEAGIKRTKAHELRAEALALKAPRNLRPLIQAMTALITDSQASRGSLATDSASAAGSGKLATEGANTQQQQGGPAKVARKTLSASAESFIGKFDGNGKGAVIRESKFDEMAKQNALNTQQALALKMELQAAGVLIGG